MFENTPSDKVQFRALGELPAPGTCLVCGNGTCEEGYVDLGIWLEYIGEGLICATCLTQCAELIGMMLKSEVAHIQHTADVLLVENINIKKDLTNANRRLAAFDAVLDRTGFNSVNDDRVVSETASESDAVTTDRESEPTESTEDNDGGRSGEDSESNESPAAALIQL